MKDKTDSFASVSSLYCLVLILVAVFWSMVMSCPFNIFNLSGFSYDADIFCTIGRSMMQGHTLYVDVWDQKGPLIFLLYGVADFLSDNNFFGILIFQSIALYALLYFSYRIASFYLSDKVATLVPLMLPLLFGERGCNPSDFLLALQVYSLYIFIKKYYLNGTEHILSQLAICSGIAFFIKYNICAFWLPFILVEIFSIYQKQGLLSVVKALALSVMAVIPLFALSFVFVSPLHFLDSYLLFCYSYGVEVKSVLLNPPVGFFTSILPRFCIFGPLEYRLPAVHIAIGLGIMLSSFIFWPRIQENKKLYFTCLASFLLIFAATFKGQFYFRHYYYSLYPFYILSVIFVLMKLCPLLKGFKGIQKMSRWHIWAKAIPIALFVCWAAYLERYHFTPRALIGNQKNADIIRLAGGEKNLLFLSSSSSSGAYNLLRINPPNAHFFKPPVSEELFPYYQEDIRECLENKVVAKVIVMGDEKNEEFDDLIKQYNYILKEKVQDIYLYELQGQVKPKQKANQYKSFLLDIS